MDKPTAQRVVAQTFKASFDRDRFGNFVNELTNGYDETKKQTMQRHADRRLRQRQCRQRIA